MVYGLLQSAHHLLFLGLEVHKIALCLFDLLVQLLYLPLPFFFDSCTVLLAQQIFGHFYLDLFVHQPDLLRLLRCGLLLEFSSDDNLLPQFQLLFNFFILCLDSVLKRRHFSFTSFQSLALILLL